MPSIDRTKEFEEITKSIKKDEWTTARANSNQFATNFNINGNSTKTNKRSEFFSRASQITHDIQDTYKKLGNLTDLVRKQSSTFGVDNADVQDMTLLIKERLSSHQRDLDALNQLSSKKTSDSTKQSELHTEHVVSTLKNRLMDTTTQFKSVLQNRTQDLKTLQDRRSRLIPTRQKSANNLPTPKGTLGKMDTNNFMLDFNNMKNPQNTQNQNSSNSNNMILLEEQQNSADNGAGSNMMQQQQQLQVARRNVGDEYIAQRTNDVLAIESTIVELSKMYSQLATLVADQGEMAERLDANMDVALANTEAAQTELLQTLQTYFSSRSLALKIFFVLFCFIIFFGVFVIN